MNKRTQSPLEKTMIDILDTAMDLEITAGWAGEELYGSEENTKKCLSFLAKKLRSAYMQLHQITGADPCRQNKT
jgi:hypothetical protein